jgi:putative NADH-flavin reductase
MSRVTEEEREALHQAAKAAVPILAKLTRDRDELNEKISHFETVIAAYEDILGRRARKMNTSQEEASEKIRPYRGQAKEHIDLVLGGGSDYTEPDLRKAIKTRFGMAYSRATIYTALRRGKGTRYEEKDGNRWRKKMA